MSALAGNFQTIDTRIRAACARSTRDPADVRLIWVSKNHPRERLLEAQDLGARLFGENRVQEALDKFPLPGEHALHFIGRLQKNKIRKVLPLAAAIHSIDSIDLLEAVDRIAGELGLRPDVFLQVNTSREPAKGGFEPEALFPALKSLPPLPHVRLVGLMTMGPVDAASGEPAGLEETRRCFRELAALLRTARRESGVDDPSPQGPLKDFAWLSMGMTGDFEIAIEEGAHFLRIGTGLFGSRET